MKGNYGKGNNQDEDSISATSINQRPMNYFENVILSKPVLQSKISTFFEHVVKRQAFAQVEKLYCNCIKLDTIVIFKDYCMTNSRNPLYVEDDNTNKYLT